MQLAHGASELGPGASDVLAAWPAQPLVWVACVLSAGAYLGAVRLVRGWSPRRTVAWLAGLAVVALALASPVAPYSESLFWVHMLQHLLLTSVAAPLLLLGAPVALGLRAAPHPARHRLAGLLHTRVLRAAGHPVVTWLAFAVVMWASHFSALYDAALEDPVVHALEHALFVGAGLAFWWPVVAIDPGARRMRFPGRLLYLLLAFPLQSFLGVALYSADRVLYGHYATPQRSWGPDALDDQKLAGTLMLVGGDLLFIAALGVLVLAWMSHEEREGRRADRRELEGQQPVGRHGAEQQGKVIDGVAE